MNTALMMALAEDRRAEQKERPCRHPQASRMPLGDLARWCAKCGSASEWEPGNLAKWGRWRKPQGGKR